MKVYTCNKFKGHYPAGVAALIVAGNRVSALKQLTAALDLSGLAAVDDSGRDLEPSDFIEIDTTTAHATVLCDGNY